MPTKTGAGGKPQEYDKSTGQFGNGSGAKNREEKEAKLEAIARKWESRTISASDHVSRDALTKAEWAEYYKKLGEIRAGTLKERRTKNGDRLLVVGNKVLIDNGKFVNPKVTTICKFVTQNDLYDCLEYYETVFNQGVKNERRSKGEK